MHDLSISYAGSINPASEFTEVRPSPIEGMGLFATVFIPQGTIWWSARPGDLLLIGRDQFQTLKNSHFSTLVHGFEKSLLVYAYYVSSHDALVFLLDNSRFVNHSFTPNSGGQVDMHPFSSMALRDIHPGEEIVEDYTAYEQCPWATLYEPSFLDGHPSACPPAGETLQAAL